MSGDSRRDRVQYIRCPNEPPGDVAHWLFLDWETRSNSTECCYHETKVRVRIRGSLKKGMVNSEERAECWAIVEPEPCDEHRYHELNDLPPRTR